jgi:type IV pilus assembly protein PilX
MTKKDFHANWKANQQERGTVLAMTLILLAVMSLLTAMTLKQSVSSEQIAKSMRTSSVALQSAETALRQCENAIRNGDTKIGDNSLVSLSMPESLVSGNRPVQWKRRANWADKAALSNPIPNSLAVATGMRPKPIARCMIEQFRLPRLDSDTTLSDPYLITAVGFSPDYQQDANANGTAGSEAWVQSIFQP